MILKKAEVFAYVLIVLLFLVASVMGFLLFYQEDKQTTSTIVAEEEAEEQMYVNNRYGFSVRVPDGWRVQEGTLVSVPAINIYPEQDADPVQPIDHFSNRTHVSIYPQGIPTQGLYAQSRPLDISLKEDVASRSYAYVLENGDIFARYVLFDTYPASWNEAGFLWTRSYVKDMGRGCFRAGERTSVSDCDPFFGDELTMTGTVDEIYLEDIEAIVESFDFIGENWEE